MVASAVIGGVAANKSAKKGAEAAENASKNSISSAERIQSRQLDLSEKEFAAAEKRNAKMDALAERVTGAQLESMGQQTALADEYATYNRNTFRPLEQRIVTEADNYDSQANLDAAAGKAGTDYMASLANRKETTARTMARMGLNPADGRSLAAMGDTGSEALGAVTAINNARDKVKTLGSAKRFDAASLGRNLPSAQATSAGLALTAGNSAVGNMATANGSQVSGLGAGVSLLNGAASTGDSIFRNSNNLFSTISGNANATQSAIGSTAGMLMNYYMNKPKAGG